MHYGRPERQSNVSKGQCGWVIERTFAWLGRYRRLSKDDEAQTESSAAMVSVAMIQIMLRRQPAPP